VNNNEAANIVEYLVGAFPGTYFSGPTAEVFVNSLQTNEYENAQKAAVEWVNSMDRFPTIAELNRTIRRLKGEADNVRQLPRSRDEVASIEVAIRAFSDGYRRQRARLGDSPDQIEEKLSVYLRKFPGSVIGAQS
jgi:hypothetical protein